MNVLNSDLTRIGDPHWDSPDIRDVHIWNLDFVPLVLFAEHGVINHRLFLGCGLVRELTSVWTSGASTYLKWHSYTAAKE